ncbi:hypothetical protein Ancab_038650 [Ancistrocladus abbreviatus]
MALCFWQFLLASSPRLNYLLSLFQIDKLLSTFCRWEHLGSDIGEQEHLSKELLAACESIAWQVDELDKAIAVAAKDPAFYGIDEVELEKRRKWTRTAHDQVSTVRKAVSAGKGLGFQDNVSVNGLHRELMRLPADHSRQMVGSNQYSQDNMISPHQNQIGSCFSLDGKTSFLFLNESGVLGWLMDIKQQDEELDELSASVQRIGHVGLTIRDELIGFADGSSKFLMPQEKIMDELGMEMDSTSNRLEFLQVILFIRLQSRLNYQFYYVL